MARGECDWKWEDSEGCVREFELLERLLREELRRSFGICKGLLEAGSSKAIKGCVCEYQYKSAELRSKKLEKTTFR